MPQRHTSDNEHFAPGITLGVRDARDRQIIATALKKAGSTAKFSGSVKSIRCVFCGSRNTKTEFYRIPPGKATFGGTACCNCGAC